jgi:FAD/FMN-containing dehydrogenase
MATPETIIDLLRSRLTAPILLPGDPGYEEGLITFYGGFEQRPAAIIRPGNAAQVSAAVNAIAGSGMELAIRGGGHSPAGHSLSDGGVVIDLGAMKSFEIDPAGRTAWAGAGLTAGEYTTMAAAHGLATGFGDTGSVGIGGITLAGGIGFLTRRNGMTIDDLLGAEVVTADGSVLAVDADHHPDLFWAIRGGGGNFGIATRFHYRLHDLPAVTGGILVLPATAETIAGFMAAAEAAPDEVTAITAVMMAPPMPFLPEEVHGKLVLIAFICDSGAPAGAEARLAPFRSLAEPLADMVRPMTYPEMFVPDDPDFHPTAVGRTLLVDAIDARSVDTILARIVESDAPMRVAQLRALGGAMARVPAEATAFAHRHRPFMINVAAFYTDPDEVPARTAWTDSFAAELQRGEKAAYVGFLGDEGAERVLQAYAPATWDRLLAVKRRYDPDNLFRRNQNITPA